MSWFSSQFFSLKTEKIPAGRLALGDRLGSYRGSTGWAFLVKRGPGSLLVMLGVGIGNSYKGAQSVPEMALFLGSTSVALVHHLESVASGFAVV